MDRLQTLSRALGLTLILSLLGGLACEDKGSSARPLARRVDSVKAERKPGASVDELCDVRFAAERAPTFAWPALAGPTPPAPAGWRWVNLWATWCKPCVEEIPRLQKWRDRLGGRVELVLLSVDESDAIVDAFRKQHPEVPLSSRVADASALPAVLKALGLDAAAPIPIHVFIDASGRTRCVRAGAVNDADLAAVESLIAG